MPTELEELADFLGSPNAQIRQVALENLAGYSQGREKSLFLRNNLKPIKDLKLLVTDIPPRSKHAITMLVNLSDDNTILLELVKDDKFLELLMTKLTDPKYPNSDLIAMLLSNMAKDDSIIRLLSTKRNPVEGVSDSKTAMDQAMDCFVKGAEKMLNADAEYDFLSYFFADISRLPLGREYFITRQDYDGVIPISKLVVFTEHKSIIRRKGVASTIKNCCFNTAFHLTLLDEDKINALPYILLPLCGPEEFSEEDMDGMPEDVQLLPPGKAREADISILLTHVESLLLLCTVREGREILRAKKVYPIIREAHLHVEDDNFEAACDRLVQIIMRDEEPMSTNKEAKIEEAEIVDDDKVVEIL